MILSEFSAQMQVQQQGMARLKKIDAIIAQLENEKAALESKLKTLQETLAKENFDLYKLENKNLAALFYSLIGTLDKHMDKERKEAAAAKLKHDQAVSELADVIAQIEKLNYERFSYIDCKKKYNDFYALKKQELLMQNSETARDIMALEEKINASKIKLKEIDEAIFAGKRVMDSLNNAYDELGRAENWGVWDMAGGGLISGIAKHGHIDNAMGDIEQVRKRMLAFKSELCDIKLGDEFGIHISETARFADVFFDGLISDWFVQAQINESQSSVVNAKSRVSAVLGKLELMQRQENIHIESLQKQLSGIVING